MKVNLGIVNEINHPNRYKKGRGFKKNHKSTKSTIQIDIKREKDDEKTNPWRNS